MLTRKNHGLNHSYLVDGVKCRGVTTIIGETMPKAGLVNWAAEVTADYSIDHADDLAALPYSKRRKALLRARFDDRDTAANRGTQVHRAAQELVHGRRVPVNDVIAAHVESYAAWLDAEDIDPVATELVVANRRVWYCGSVDLIAEYRGAMTLIDLTTSRSGIFREKALQICAYRWAEVYSLDAWADEDERPLAGLGIEATGAVHIRADGCDYRPTVSGPEVFDYFRHLAYLHAQEDDAQTWVGVADDPAPAAEAPALADA